MKKFYFTHKKYANNVIGKQMPQLKAANKPVVEKFNEEKHEAKKRFDYKMSQLAAKFGGAAHA